MFRDRLNSLFWLDESWPAQGLRFISTSTEQHVTGARLQPPVKYVGHVSCVPLNVVEEDIEIGVGQRLEVCHPSRTTVLGPIQELQDSAGFLMPVHSKTCKS
jgi:hypothetical protein